MRCFKMNEERDKIRTSIQKIHSLQRVSCLSFGTPAFNSNTITLDGFSIWYHFLLLSHNNKTCFACNATSFQTCVPSNFDSHNLGRTFLAVFKDTSLYLKSVSLGTQQQHFSLTKNHSVCKPGNGPIYLFHSLEMRFAVILANKYYLYILTRKFP